MSLTVPRHWTTRSDPPAGLVVLARAPAAPPGGLAPEIVVRTCSVGVGLDRWRAEALASLAHQLDDLEVEDDDRFELDGRPVAYHRLGHRLSRRGAALDVVTEQWAWLVDGAGVTLTASVARADYADYADLFEEVAATLAPLVSAGTAPGSGRRGAAHS